MKKIMPLLLTSYIYFCQYALSQVQVDSIFTSKENIAVNIIEITEDAVKFSYPGEDLINSIYKNTVLKIKYKSGRVEVFTESSSFKLIKGGEDWEKISITRVENELKGLFKLEEVTSNAKGSAFETNANHVKDRAFKQLKIKAAMLGGNIIYIIEQQTEIYKSGWFRSNPAQTNLSGVAYSNTIPNFDDFKNIVNNKSEFEYLELQYFGNGNDATDVKIDSYIYQSIVKITEVRNENGFIMVKTNLKGKDTIEYRITYFDDQKIALMCRDKAKIYNVILKR